MQFNVSLETVQAAIQQGTAALVGEPVPTRYQVLEDADLERSDPGLAR